MPVTRERVDPVRTADERLLVHRRWILPDDLEREMPLLRLAPLWRGLAELEVLSGGDEVRMERLNLPPAAPSASQELNTMASAGALLGGGGAATLLTQMVWLHEDRRDPYGGESDPDDWRDYTLYAVAHDGFLLMPLLPEAIRCAACGNESAPLAGEPGADGVWKFGEAGLLDLSRRCPGCQGPLDLGRDKARLRNGAVFLLEETCARAAFSIELPAAPEDEEMPDARVAALLQSAFGGTDELADDQTPAAK